MSTNNTGFYEEISEIIPESSSNTHVRCSSDYLTSSGDAI